MSKMSWEQATKFDEEKLVKVLSQACPHVRGKVVSAVISGSVSCRIGLTEAELGALD